MIGILSVPFVVHKKRVFSGDEESVEIALAFLLAWRRASSGGELLSISRFFFPVHLVPADDENMVAVEASGSLSGMVFHYPSFSFSELSVNRLESFVDELRAASSHFRKIYSKPLKTNLPGILSGAPLKGLVDRLHEVEQWNVNSAELVPEKVSLKAAVGCVSSINVLTKINLERIAESFRENVKLIDEKIALFREEVGRLEEEAEKERQKLRKVAQEKIEKERKRFEDEVKRIDASKFLEKPPATTSLSHYARKLEKAISDATSGGDPEVVLEKIGVAIGALKEAVEAFVRAEKEYLGYLNRRDQFEREKESLKKKAEKEFRKEEERLLREMEREVAKVGSEAEQMRHLLSEAVRLRNDYEEYFRKWITQARSQVEANKVFLIPSSALTEKPPVTIYVPFFAFRLLGEKDEVALVPPLIVDASGVNPSTSLEELVSLSLSEEMRGAISSGLKKLNYLLNPEVASLFSRGIGLLTEAGVVKKREAENVKSFYDQYLKPAF
ncbi:MAG: hypothetical protein QXN15_10285 [Candidatus Jordarchaeales archaeon]|nr:hypothetical protein [Candidatus Jordarchaeia archaeon]